MESHQSKCIGGSAMIEARLMRWFVAATLLDARLSCKMTRSESAKAYGCSQQTIYYWERGERHPRLSEVAQIAETYNLSEEIKGYLKIILGNPDAKRLEADARFHALTLAKAELHSGVMFKYEPFLVHGPLQTRDYYFLVPQAAEKLSHSEAVRGWSSRERRKKGIRERKVKPIIHYLMGDSAIYGLRKLPKEVGRELVKELIEQDALPNIEMRVIADYHPARSTACDIFAQGESPTAPPAFVYTEAFHGSWCIEEEDLVARYHEACQAMWLLGIPLKEFLYEHCRDLLA